MGEVLWIKLSTRFFDDVRVKFLESLPDRDTLIYIYVRLLVQAGCCNAGGYVFLTERIPLSAEMLANIFCRPLNTVKLALQTFQELEMLSIEETGAIKIMGWEEQQNLVGLERIKEINRQRAREYRKRLHDEKAKKTNEGVPALAGGEKLPSHDASRDASRNVTQQKRKEKKRRRYLFK